MTDNVITLVPANEQSLRKTSMFWRVIRWVSIGIGALLFVAILGRLALAVVISNEVGDQFDRIASTAGLEHGIARWLDTVGRWALGFALTGVLIHTVIWALIPFYRARRTAWKPVVWMVGLTGVLAAIPAAVKTVRGVDDSGLPAFVEAIERPDSARWFNPAGDPLLSFVTEGDGTINIYNRVGHRASDGRLAKPVSPAIRDAWEKQQRKTQAIDEDRKKELLRQQEEQAKRQTAAEREARLLRQEEARRKKELAQQIEAARLDAERRAKELAAAEAARLLSERNAETLRREKEAAQRELARVRAHRAEKPSPATTRSAARRQAAPKVTNSTVSHQPSTERSVPRRTPPRAIPVEPASPPAPTPSNYRLIPGRVLNVHVHGDEVFVSGNGPVSVSADGRRWRDVPPRKTIRFCGFLTIHARPLSRSATSLKLERRPR